MIKKLVSLLKPLLKSALRIIWLLIMISVAVFVLMVLTRNYLPE